MVGGDMPKKITINCSGPLAVRSDARAFWEDVYLSWMGKPWHKKYRVAPCLCSKTEVDSHYQSVLECQNDIPKLDWSSERKKSELIISKLAEQDIYIDDPWSDMPDIYTSEESIDYLEAERMIAKLMKFYGFENIECKWKRPRLIVAPV